MTSRHSVQQHILLFVATPQRFASVVHLARTSGSRLLQNTTITTTTTTFVPGSFCLASVFVVVHLILSPSAPALHWFAIVVQVACTSGFWHLQTLVHDDWHLHCSCRGLVYVHVRCCVQCWVFKDSNKLYCTYMHSILGWSLYFCGWCMSCTVFSHGDKDFLHWGRVVAIWGSTVTEMASRQGVCSV